MEQIKKNAAEMMSMRAAGKHEECANKFISDGAVLMGPMHEPATKKEMLEMHKSGKFAMFEKAEIKHTIDNIEMVGDMAIDRGTMVAKLPTGEKKGNYLTIWKKEGSDWKITSACSCFRVECPK